MSTPSPAQLSAMQAVITAAREHYTASEIIRKEPSFATEDDLFRQEMTAEALHDALFLLDRTA